MHKEMKKIVQTAESQGFEVKPLKTGHVIFFKGGRKVTTFSGTPGDHRGWKNSISYLRKAGCVI